MSNHPIQMPKGGALSVLKWFIALVMLCTVPACASAPPSDTDTSTAQVVQHISVQPFYDMTAAYGENSSVRSPLTGKAFVTGEVAPRASEFMTNEVARLLQRQFENVQVSLSPQPVVETEHLAGIQNRSTFLTALQSSGRSSGADAVLIGFLYDFQERIGRDYGVQKPARLVFELNLISVVSGRMLWQARFAETQQSLSDNLFELGKFIKRKGRWVTAKEMAGVALEEKVVELSKIIH